MREAAAQPILGDAAIVRRNRMGCPLYLWHDGRSGFAHHHDPIDPGSWQIVARTERAGEAFQALPGIDRGLPSWARIAAPNGTFSPLRVLFREL